jgi:uncharacterized protein (UPF0179 family)
MHHKLCQTLNAGVKLRVVFIRSNKLCCTTITSSIRVLHVHIISEVPATFGHGMTGNTVETAPSIDLLMNLQKSAVRAKVCRIVLHMFSA